MSTINFFPYVRKGISRNINEGDKLGNSSADGTKNRPEIAIKSEIGSNSFTKTIKIAGPGDVLKINANAIMRVFPKPNGLIKAKELPYIEFWEPDFAWRYTPAKANDEKLRPWLALVTCEKKFTIEENKNGISTVIFDVNKDEDYKQIFPSPQKIYLSAHAQGESKTEATFCRILNLNEPKDTEKCYKTFLIPVFETGRLRGLGYDEDSLDKIPAQQCAWEASLDDQKKRNDPLKFPVYYSWEFRVAGETFHTLAQRLKSNNNVSNGIEIDVTSLGNGLDYDQLGQENRPKRESISMPTALTPPTATVKTFPSKESDKELFTRLHKLLSQSPVFEENRTEKNETKRNNLIDNGDDPWVTPPIYGAKHVLASSLDDQNLPWVSEINLDLNYRAAAGLGKKVIQRHQEEFVHRAWKQVEAVKAINAEINKQVLSANVNTFFKNRNITTTQKEDEKKDESLVTLMTKYSAMREQKKDNGKSISELLQKKGISQSFTSPLFQKKVQAFSNRNKSIEFKTIMETIADGQILKIPEPKFNAPNLYELENFCETILDKLILGKNAISNFLSFPSKKIFNNIYNKTNDPNPFADTTIISYFDLGTSGSHKAEMNLIWDKKKFSDPIANKDNFPNAAIEFEKINGRKFSSLGCTIKNGDDIDNTLKKLEKCFTFNLGANESITASPKENPSTTDDLNLRKYATAERLKFDTQNFPKVNVEINKLGIKNIQERDFETNNIARNFLNPKEQPYVILNNPELASALLLKLPRPNVFALEATCFYEIFPDEQKPIVKIKIDEGKNVIFLNRDKILNSPIELRKYFHFYDSDKTKIPSPADKPTEGISPPSIYIKKASDQFNNLNTANNENWPILHKYINHYYSVPTYILVEEELFNEGNNNRYIHTYKNLLEYFNKNKSYIAFESLIDVQKKLKAFPKKTTDEEPPEGPQKPDNSDENKARQILNNFLDDATTKRLKGRIKDYYKKFFSQDPEYIKNLLGIIPNSKYPIMTYPIFPEPTYYYLKNISDEFILPGIDDLPNDSISMFNNCPAFIESFLCGMNTEMGRELLWREYPTDQRGSYFKKFWDSDIDELEKYDDIINIPDWKDPLGKNHDQSKGKQLVFAIKGELMKSYPDTKIRLKKANLKGNTSSIVPKGKRTFQLEVSDEKTLEPESQAFIRDDIYVVGFNIDFKEALGSPKPSTGNGYFLSFEQAPENITFEKKDSPPSEQNSAKYAKGLISNTEIYYKHILTLTNK